MANVDKYLKYGPDGPTMLLCDVAYGTLTRKEVHDICVNEGIQECITNALDERNISTIAYQTVYCTPRAKWNQYHLDTLVWYYKRVPFDEMYLNRIITVRDYIREQEKAEEKRDKRKKIIVWSSVAATILLGGAGFVYYELNR